MSLVLSYCVFDDDVHLLCHDRCCRYRIFAASLCDFFKTLQPHFTFFFLYRTVGNCVVAYFVHSLPAYFVRVLRFVRIAVIFSFVRAPSRSSGANGHPRCSRFSPVIHGAVLFVISHVQHSPTNRFTRLGSQLSVIQSHS